MILGLKFLDGEFSDLKKISFRYFGFSVVTNAFF